MAIILPIVLAAGAGAMDLSAAHAKKHVLQRAADSAALAAARDTESPESAIQNFARLNAQQEGFSNLDIALNRDNDIATVSMEGDAPTFMLGLLGMKSLRISVSSTAQSVSGAPKYLEVALALDVTESMANDMDELREAAKALVTELHDIGSERVKVSIVPYAGAVNIGTSDDRRGWLDTSALSQHHAMDIERRPVAWCYTPPPPSTTTTTTSTTTSTSTTGGGGSSPSESCTDICGCPGTPACGGGGDGASLYPQAPIWFAKMFGVTPATASSQSIPPFNLDTCEWKYTPDQISHLDLFGAIQGVDWGGCVEARPDPYDVTDEAPDVTNADTLFTPYFWSDDRDRYGTDGYGWANEYVADQIAPQIDSTREYNGDGSKLYWHTTEANMRSNVWKYTMASSADMNLTPPNVTGPNRGCPDQLQTLSDDLARTKAKIDSLVYRTGGGTVLSQGLVWAWRTLSPNSPFTGGAPYSDEETRKIVILMSDGANAVIKREDSEGKIVDWDRRGDYTAYGYAADFDEQGRSRGYIDTSLSSAPYFDQIRGYLDGRTRAVCDNIKAVSPDNPVEIYTVLMGPDSSRAVNLLQQCATSVEHHYERAIRASDLGAAFERITASIAGSTGSRIVN